MGWSDDFNEDFGIGVLEIWLLDSECDGWLFINSLGGDSFLGFVSFSFKLIVVSDSV